MMFIAAPPWGSSPALNQSSAAAKPFSSPTPPAKSLVSQGDSAKDVRQEEVDVDETEVSRGLAEEIAALAKCGDRLVYKIVEEMKSAAAPCSNSTPPAQPPVAQGDSGEDVRQQQGDVDVLLNSPASSVGAAEKVGLDRYLTRIGMETLAKTVRPGAAVRPLHRRRGGFEPGVMVESR